MAENRMTPKAFIGMELRRAREAKGLSRAKVAKLLIVSESLVTKWERGDLIPLEDHLTGTNQAGTESVQPGLSDVLELPEILLRLIHELVLNDEGSEWNQWPIIVQEASAHWTFQPSVIPGMLQTENYARVTLQAHGVTDDLEEKLAARLKRQEILTKDDPPTYVALISEAVLRRNIGDARVMHEQLEHLEQMAQRPETVVQIIPESAPACAIFVSGFAIASVDGEERAFVETQVRGTIVKHAKDTLKLQRSFDIIRADALDRRDSLEAIRKAKEQWTT
jgi:transcriptional regulator with XRE-family HTH domain